MMKRRIILPRNGRILFIYFFEICNENRLFKLIIMINYNNIILLSISK